MNSNKHTIAWILLIFFSCMQLVDVHKIGHDDDDDQNCEICTLASENLNSDFLPTAILCLPDIIQIPADIIITHYKNQYINSYRSFPFLNKAPPIV